MKNKLILLIALLITIKTMAQQARVAAPVAKKNPKATIANKPAKATVASPVKLSSTADEATLNLLNGDVHDFGDMKEGEIAVWDFLISNAGKQPLILQDVKPSCSCTAPEWPKAPIMAGEKSKITARYDTKGRPGAFTKTLTVTSNDKLTTKVLTIKGNVIAAPPTTDSDNKQNELK